MLTQEAADYLARIAKQITGATVIIVPAAGGQGAWQASADGGKHRFHLHMPRGRKVTTQATLQERFESNEILLRLDIDGPSHANPDGVVVPTPHLHIYTEGYDDKWAFPVPPELAIGSGDPAELLISFLRYCGVLPSRPFKEVCCHDRFGGPRSQLLGLAEAEHHCQGA